MKFYFFCTFSIDPWFRSAQRWKIRTQNPQTKGQFASKHTHSREEVIVKFLVWLGWLVFVMLFSFWLQVFALHSCLLVVVVILCWFQPNYLIVAFFFAVLTYSFVLFVLCVRMKVWLHFIAWKCLKITWFVFVSYTFIYRFKCRDKINASFCIFISSSLSFWVTFKAFYSSLL